MAYRCTLSLLPTRFNKPTFVVVGTVTSPANERSRLNRKPLPFRILSFDMLMYTLYIMYASIPLLLRFNAFRSLGSFTPSVFLFPGPTLKILTCILKTSVPLRYMLWPPTVPGRAQLVEEDEKGVKRPKKNWQREKGSDSLWWFWMSACEMCVILWS